MTVFSLVLLIFPRWRPDAIKGGEEEEEEEKTNLLTIQMRFYLISMVDPWFPISKNKAKHHSKEKPLDEAKIAKLLDLLDNILAGFNRMKQKGLHPITLPLFGPEKRKISCLNLGTTG